MGASAIDVRCEDVLGTYQFFSTMLGSGYLRSCCCCISPSTACKRLVAARLRVILQAPFGSCLRDFGRIALCRLVLACVVPQQARRSAAVLVRRCTRQHLTWQLPFLTAAVVVNNSDETVELVFDACVTSVVTVLFLTDPEPGAIVC